MNDLGALYVEAARIQKELGDDAARAWFERLPSEQREALQKYSEEMLEEVHNMGKSICGEADDPDLRAMWTPPPKADR